MENTIVFEVIDPENDFTLEKFSEGAAGIDIAATTVLAAYKGDRAVDAKRLEKIKESFEKRGYLKLRSLERVLFGSGIKVSLPKNLELQVRSRSGLSLNKGLVVLNSPATIDSDYRGEIGILMYNTTPFLNPVKRGQRVAQLVPKEIPNVEWEQGVVINNTARGAEGFGSTGE